MVMSFFRKGESGLDVVAHRTISMLGDARHSFDLASAAVLSGASAADVGVGGRGGLGGLQHTQCSDLS